MAALSLALLGSIAASGGEAQAQSMDGCPMYTVTAYSAEQYPGRTADGTSTWEAIRTGEAIAAGSWNLPLGTTVEVEKIGTYRIADRGHLESSHVDILTATTAEALQIGRQYRRVCVVE